MREHERQRNRRGEERSVVKTGEVTRSHGSEGQGKRHPRLWGVWESFRTRRQRSRAVQGDARVTASCCWKDRWSKLLQGGITKGRDKRYARDIQRRVRTQPTSAPRLQTCADRRTAFVYTAEGQRLSVTMLAEWRGSAGSVPKPHLFLLWPGVRGNPVSADPQDTTRTQT